MAKRIGNLGEIAELSAANRPLVLLLAGTMCMISGCVRDHYYYGLGANGTEQRVPCACASTNPVAYGGDHPRVDELERVAQAPKKFFKRIFGQEDQAGQDPEQLRLEAAALSQEYLIANGLDDVYIDARRYEPAEQWSRLKTNDRIAPFWKYTAGTLNVVGYTLLPRRALHSDAYNPFTNTLNINSVKPASALYQAARAKEYRKQRWLGTYAVLQQAPGVPLFHHANAASDALTYAQVSGQWDLTREIYATSYSQLGSAVVSDAMIFAPIPANAPPLATPLVKVAGRATGRMVGQFVAQRQDTMSPFDEPAQGQSPSFLIEDQEDRSGNGELDERPVTF